MAFWRSFVPMWMHLPRVICEISPRSVPASGGLWRPAWPNGKVLAGTSSLLFRRPPQSHDNSNRLCFRF